MPEQPFVLLGQQYLADLGRSVGNVHPVWTYAYVPHGWTGDATDAITDQIERFAPGVRDRIIGTQTCSTSGLADFNPNFAGGSPGAHGMCGAHAAAHALRDLRRH